MTLEELLSARDGINARIAELMEGVKTAHVVKFTQNETSCFAEGYYNSCFVAKARGLKGSFSNGKWAFKSDVAEHVKNALKQCYGVDGTEPYPVTKITVSGWNAQIFTDGLELFGRPIARAWDRDGGAKVADDIFLIDGKLTSGGSVKNWMTKAIGATFEIHNFPTSCLERDDVKKAVEDGWAKIG